MTLQQILAEVQTEKPCSKRSVLRYLAALGIRPLGARQRPQHYPADSALSVLAHLGFRDSLPAAERQVVSLRTLQRVRREAQKRRKAA